MSKRKEKISAFLDGDMHRDELMSFSLSAETDDAKVAQRYQMLGDTLRGEMSDSSFVDVSHAVREALAEENIVEQMSSATSQSSASLLGITASATTAGKSTAFDLSAWFKPVAGMAVAASVAVVMVVSVNQQESTSIAPVATVIEAQPIVQLAAEDIAGNKNVAGNKATDLNPYINQHLEFATQDTFQGRLPYVRAVSFEPESLNTEAAK